VSQQFEVKVSVGGPSIIKRHPIRSQPYVLANRDEDSRPVYPLCRVNHSWISYHTLYKLNPLQVLEIKTPP
jgi:hypothetical protein